MAVKFKSYLAEIEKDLVKAEKAVLKKAAQHVRKKIVEKVKSLFRVGRGNLIKGIVYDVDEKDSAFVGLGPPARHGHLLEFGTKERVQKKQGMFMVSQNIQTKKGNFMRPVGGRVGHVKPTPFVLPTFEEQAAKIEEILSERWI